MAKTTATTATPPVPPESSQASSPPQESRSSSSPPEVTFRVGRVTASVFINQTKSNGNGNGERTRRFRSVSVQRSYKDEKGNTQFVSSFGLGEIRNAIRVLELAAEHMEQKESVWTT